MRGGGMQMPMTDLFRCVPGMISAAEYVTCCGTDAVIKCSGKMLDDLVCSIIALLENV